MTNEIQTLRERLKAKTTEMIQIRKELTEEFRVNLGALVKECFDTCPLPLKSVGIHAYVPSFCDGDPCEFTFCPDVDSLHFDGIQFDGEDYNEETGEYEASPYYVPYSDPDRKAKIAPLMVFSELFSMIGEDIMQDLFGDCFLVTFLPDGTYTNEYYDCGY